MIRVRSFCSCAFHRTAYPTGRVPCDHSLQTIVWWVGDTAWCCEDGLLQEYTVKPVLRDHCIERPPVLIDQQCCIAGTKIFISHWIQPVLRDHLHYRTTFDCTMGGRWRQVLLNKLIYSWLLYTLMMKLKSFHFCACLGELASDERPMASCIRTVFSDMISALLCLGWYWWSAGITVVIMGLLCDYGAVVGLWGCSNVWLQSHSIYTAVAWLCIGL